MSNSTFAMPNIIDSHDMGLRTVLQSRRPKNKRLFNAYSTCSLSLASTSNTLGRSVSAETVRRVLRKAGYNGRAARKRPLIGKRNRIKRLKFAK
ncbi:hypothetical protein TNCV_3172921 [Trichonephila clavipes]|nr:hypothetical protein TNCV_3172921 [Trichonephila clavipes]